MLEHWNDGIMGYGKMVKWVIGKFRMKNFL